MALLKSAKEVQSLTDPKFEIEFEKHIETIILKLIELIDLKQLRGHYTANISFTTNLSGYSNHYELPPGTLVYPDIHQHMQNKLTSVLSDMLRDNGYNVKINNKITDYSSVYMTLITIDWKYLD